MANGRIRIWTRDHLLNQRTQQYVTPQRLDGFSVEFSYRLHLMIGLSCVKVNHGRRLAETREGFDKP